MSSVCEQTVACNVELNDTEKLCDAPVKFFVTSDIHENATIVEKLVSFLKNDKDIRLVVICGDTTNILGLKSVRLRTFNAIRDRVREVCPETHFVFGNCEPFEDDFPLMLTEHLELPFGFVGIPFPYVLKTPFVSLRERSEEEIETLLCRHSITRKSIVFAHGPPHGVCDRTSKGVHVGSQAVRTVIEKSQPHAWFCGHIHEARGIERLGDTMVCNVACDAEESLLCGVVSVLDENGILSSEFVCV